MGRTLLQIIAVTERVARDLTLVPEVIRKIKARSSYRMHQARVSEYPLLAGDPFKSVADLLEVDVAIVNNTIKSESFRDLVMRLEEHKEDGSAFLELIYAIIRIHRPQTTLETGVSRGFSTAAILQALKDNGSGKLYSTDLPAFLPHETSKTGRVIPHSLTERQNWELILGPDRKILPDLLKRIPAIDLFHYDSDKSYEGMLNTWNLVWPQMKSGAILMVDDIHAHDGFLEFVEQHELSPYIVSKPSNQGVYNWQGTYLVGLVRKP